MQILLLVNNSMCLLDNYIMEIEKNVKTCTGNEMTIPVQANIPIHKYIHKVCAR